jgi:predicted alpha/beta superfamily hydrolase
MGTVSKLTPAFNSTNLTGGMRTVWVYLPPVYLENTAAKLPVMYMFDGQNLFDASLAFGHVEWQVDEAFDNASAGGRCPDDKVCQSDGDCGGARCDSFREAIVIAPENAGANRLYEYTPTFDAAYNPSGGGDKTLDAFVNDLKPRIDQSYRTLTGPADTGILGSSLGGLMSAYAGVTRANVFGLNGIMSPSTWWNGNIIISKVMGMGQPRPSRVYVDSGDSGDANDDVTQTTMLAQAYANLGYQPGQNLLHIVAPGQDHEELYWAMRLPGALRFLLGPRER